MGTSSVHEPEPPKAPVHKSQLRPNYYKQFIGLDRVRGLSDGVFAIIITLLVIEVRGIYSCIFYNFKFLIFQPHYLWMTQRGTF